MKYWRRQKVRVGEQWLILAMGDWLSHWDLMCSLEFQSLGKSFEETELSFQWLFFVPVLWWSKQGGSIYSFSQFSSITEGVKEFMVVGWGGGRCSSQLSRSESRETRHDKNMAWVFFGPAPDDPCLPAQFLVLSLSKSVGEKASKSRSLWGPFLLKISQI